MASNFVFSVGKLHNAIFSGIPDVLGRHRARYVGHRVLVVGSGHSAFNALLDLSTLAEQVPSTHVVWAIRRQDIGQLFGGGERDGLPARGQLGQRIHDLVEHRKVHLVTGVSIDALRRTAEGIVIAGEEERIGPVDEIIATTGFRPDLSLVRELRVALDPSVESPVALAPLIDPNGASGMLSAFGKGNLLWHTIHFRLWLPIKEPGTGNSSSVVYSDDTPEGHEERELQCTMRVHAPRSLSQYMGKAVRTKRSQVAVEFVAIHRY